MTIKILIPAITVCALMSTNANAAQKCVKLGSGVSCPNGTGAVGGINWSTTCSNGVVISGIGVCSSDIGSGFGETRDTLTISEYNQNNYCWCKALSPAVSKYWIRGANGYDGADCVYNCANGCANSISYPTFQSNMLNGFE